MDYPPTAQKSPPAVGSDVKGVNRDQSAVRQIVPYSITSFARASNKFDTLRSNAFAVFKFTNSSKRAGRSAGRSAGFAPFQNLSGHHADFTVQIL